LMHGLNMAFIAMALSALALAVLAILGTGKSVKTGRSAF
jgi:hypothetical protein